MIEPKKDEKFKQFVSHLDIAVHNVQLNVDENSLSQNKFMNLLHIAPKYIQAKLLEEGISDFKATIASANILKSIHLASLSLPAKAFRGCIELSFKLKNNFFKQAFHITDISHKNFSTILGFNLISKCTITSASI